MSLIGQDPNNKISQTLDLFYQLYKEPRYRGVMDAILMCVKSRFNVKDMQKLLRFLGHYCGKHCRGELMQMLAAALTMKYIQENKGFPRPEHLDNNISICMNNAIQNTIGKQYQREMKKGQYNGQQGQGQGQQQQWNDSYNALTNFVAPKRVMSRPGGY